jgi:hypothetical protein
MLHAAAGQTGGADAKEESQNSKQASHRDAVLLACTSSQQRKAGNAETEFLRLLCRLALCSPKNIQMALLRAWCYGWRAAVRSGKTVRKEGQRR